MAISRRMRLQPYYPLLRVPIITTHKNVSVMGLMATYLERFLLCFCYVPFGNSFTLFGRVEMNFWSSYVYLNSVWR